MTIKGGQLKEKEDYQAYIIEMLTKQNNYKIRKATFFDAGYGMDKEQLFEFLYATQKKTMNKIEKLNKEKNLKKVD